LAALGAASVARANAGAEGWRRVPHGIFDALRVLGLALGGSSAGAHVVLRIAVAGLCDLPAWFAVVTVGVCLGRAPAMQAELASPLSGAALPLQWLGG